jgi:hypothetical protein
VGDAALPHGYRVLALIDETWTEFAAKCEIRTAEDAARRLDEMMFARKGNVRGWAVLDSHERTVSSDTPAGWPPPEAVETPDPADTGRDGPFVVKVERCSSGWVAIAGKLAAAGWPWWWVGGVACVRDVREDAIAAAVADAVEHRRKA